MTPAEFVLRKLRLMAPSHNNLVGAMRPCTPSGAIMRGPGFFYQEKTCENCVIHGKLVTLQADFIQKSMIGIVRAELLAELTV